jgi:hypothetical protein
MSVSISSHAVEPHRAHSDPLSIEDMLEPASIDNDGSRLKGGMDDMMNGWEKDFVCLGSIE